MYSSIRPDRESTVGPDDVHLASQSVAPCILPTQGCLGNEGPAVVVVQRWSLVERFCANAQDMPIDVSGGYPPGWVNSLETTVRDRIGAEQEG